MPYLQLDVNGPFAPDVKQRLAAALSETYARMMSVDNRRISVAIRELGEGGIWKAVEAGGTPGPAAVLMLDIRQGRPADVRLALAKALTAHCAEILGLAENCLSVEFTQHSGDEMYHPALGGWSPDWEPEER